MRVRANISAHITYAEATKSQTALRLGIDNTPTAEVLKRMRLVAETIFEPIRLHFGIPIAVSSFYRSPELNKAMGGAKTSQHVTGEAIDIDADVFGGLTNMQIFNYVLKNLPFDQLIHEYGTKKIPAWIHVSYKATGNRRQVIYLK